MGETFAPEESAPEESAPEEFTPEELAELAAKASSLDDRLAGRYVPATAAADSAGGDGAERQSPARARLEQWRRVVDGRDGTGFARRLRWDNLDEEAVRRALGDVCLAPGEPLPAWTELLAAAAAAAAELATASWETKGQGELRCLRVEQPLPFEEVVVPFVLVARRRVAARAGRAAARLTDAAHGALEHSLVQRLALLCARPLEWEFSVVRAERRSAFGRLLARLQGDPGRDLYLDFVRDLHRGRLRPFFREYAVLARLVATVTGFWVDAVSEFLLRLDADWPALQATFGGEAGSESVTSVRAGLSDAHNGGRSTHVVTFASGVRLVYKPKALGLEAAFFELLEWLNGRGAPLPFKVLRVLDRTTYGWVEFADHLPCHDRADAERYYRRAGMLLAVLYALGATDCHFENIVASREHPVLVDTETLLYTKASPFEEATEGLGAVVAAGERLERSVLATGLLPGWMIGPDGRSVDLSGLGWVNEQESYERVPRWDNVNTDDMSLAQGYVTMRPWQNVLTLDGRIVSPNEFGSELEEGFVALYRLLVREREALLAPEGLLARLGRERVRFIFRATRLYGKVLTYTLNREFLRDGLARSFELEALSRPLLTTETPSLFWPLWSSERQALECCDVPHFTVAADDDSLPLGGGAEVAHCLAQTPLAFAAAQIRSLDEHDLKRQLTYIRTSLFARATGRGAELRSARSDGDSPGAAGVAAPADFVAAADAIGRELDEQAIRSADGSATWIGFAYVPRAERFRLQAVGYDLYNGAAGIALFLAALERVAGGGRWRGLALGALQPLRGQLRDRPALLVDANGIGGASGCGGMAYALTWIGRLLEEPGLVEEGHAVASLLTPERIFADDILDVTTGTAGALLSLLAVHEATGDPALLERAVLCGQHLLERLRPGPTGPRAWPNHEGEILAGYSHGAAGIAYALLRLAVQTGEAAFRDGAAEGIAFERSVFSPEARNWPDLRSSSADDPHPFMTSWCHGAPGVALGRLGGLPGLDTPQIREDLEVGLATTCEYPPRGVDHLCCGTLGRTDILLTAARRLNRKGLADVAYQSASAVVERAEARGRYFLLASLPEGVYSPGFFQGTAGIGYGLLRLAQPDLLPSVLLWEGAPPREPRSSRA